MIKKKCFLFLILVFVNCFFSFTESLAEETAVTAVSKSNYGVFFNGFDFEDFEPSKYGLKERIQEESKVIKEWELSKTPFSIVGHSQGGLRSLAYLSYVEKNEIAIYNQISSVITVSGVDKGLKALEGGFPAVKSRAMTDVNIIWNGMRATVAAIPLVGNILGFLIPTDLSSTINFVTGTMQTANNISVSLFDKSLYPSPIAQYVVLALNNTQTDELQEIKDMIPQSSFITNNVVSSTKHTYKVQTGTNWYLTWASKKLGFIRIYYLKKVTEPVYTTYATYEDVPKFNTQKPIGYIVGLKSNTLSMLDSSLENETRDVVSKMESVFNTAQIVHIVKCCGFLGLISGSVGYAQDADKAKKWMRDFDDELNELKMSTENDGLVAKESQYINKTFYNPNNGTTKIIQPKTLGRDSRGYVTFDLNHKEIIYNDDVKQMISTMQTQAKYF